MACTFLRLLPSGMGRARKVIPDLLEIDKFVKDCATTFGWEDLSEDIVMDLGCGKGLHCTKAILENFPNVKSIIALDGSPEKLQEITFKSPQITEFLADILKREDIRPYEKKVDKVISTYVLHRILKKKKVLKNVYRLLKPGGEAGFFFTLDLGLYHVLEILRKDARFESCFKGSNLHKIYSSELYSDNYTEMLEKIGFKVIKIGVKKDFDPINHFEAFENVFLFNNVLEAFSPPEELVSVLKESASHLYRSKFSNQRSFYVGTLISIFVTKPCKSDNA